MGQSHWPTLYDTFGVCLRDALRSLTQLAFAQVARRLTSTIPLSSTEQRTTPPRSITPHSTANLSTSSTCTSKCLNPRPKAPPELQDRRSEAPHTYALLLHYLSGLTRRCWHLSTPSDDRAPSPTTPGRAAFTAIHTTKSLVYSPAILDIMSKNSGRGAAS